VSVARLGPEFVDEDLDVSCSNIGLVSDSALYALQPYVIARSQFLKAQLPVYTDKSHHDAQLRDISKVRDGAMPDHVGETHLQSKDLPVGLKQSSGIIMFAFRTESSVTCVA
jgi:hypothetical protein